MRPDGYPQAHIRVKPGAAGREQVYKIGKELSGLGPVILLDERRGVANVVLTERGPVTLIREAARRANARVLPGLNNPTAAFLRQTQCAKDRPCDVSADTACEFAAEVSPQHFAHYFKAYAEKLSYGGYATLAVLYEQDDPDKVLIKVPMYDHCSIGGDQLERAWKGVSSGEAVSFTKTSKSPL
jgi:hypothetical protein